MTNLENVKVIKPKRKYPGGREDMRFVMRVLSPWNWKKYEGDVVHGISCAGDPKVGPTTGSLSIVSGVLWRWKTVAILRVTSLQEGYVGYVAHDGATFLCMVPVPAGSAFGMLIGHEPVTFFAVARVEGEWQPVELELVARARRDDSAYKDVPLY